MPLQLDYTSLTQTEYPQAYFRVIELTLNYDQHQGVIHVSGFKDVNASNVEAQPIAQTRYPLGVADFVNTFGIAKLKNQDPVSAAYVYLLTLPDFLNATVVP